MRDKVKKLRSDTSKRPRAKRVKKPKHRVVTHAFDFPMEVNAKQSDKLWMHIVACWRLRNILVEDRIENSAANKLLKQQGSSEDLHISLNPTSTPLSTNMSARIRHCLKFTVRSGRM